MQELKIPRDCYKYGSGVEQVANEGGKPYEITGISTNETIQMSIAGAMATWAVYVDGNILSKTNAIKSLFIESIKILTRKQFILGTLYTFLNTKELERFIESFNKQAFRIAVAGDEPYFLKEKHMTPCSRELQFSIFTFLFEIGINEDIADRFSEIFSHILEYDNAYRYRFMDIMGETTKEDLKSSHRAINGLIEVIKQRENNQCGDKYLRIAKLLHLALYIPKIKRAFLRTLEQTDIENLQPQQADLYWMCSENSYPFMGMTNEERTLYAQEKGWKYPEGML
jgi:hypothetical protein